MGVIITRDVFAANECDYDSSNTVDLCANGLRNKVFLYTLVN